jgi:hypothetical protein
LVILNDDGATEEAAGTGPASDAAAKARVASEYFIMNL